MLVLSAASASAQDDARPARTGLDTGLPANAVSGLQTNLIVPPANTTPMKRLETRISNRVQSRIHNRIERIPGTRSTTPLQTQGADAGTGGAGGRRTGRR